MKILNSLSLSKSLKSLPCVKTQYFLKKANQKQKKIEKKTSEMYLFLQYIHMLLKHWYLIGKKIY